MSLAAVQHVRRMRGGSQAHLMRCSDGNYYVVKFRNNPQHPRVLANELLASRLAQSVGLPVANAAVVYVGESLIIDAPQLTIQRESSSVPCEAGLQCGSRFAVSPLEGRVFDLFPAADLPRLRNTQDFAGMLVFDKWTGNTDNRQAIFWRRLKQKKYTVTFIDQGYCFNGGEWSFPDTPLQGVYLQREVYQNVKGWESFEPWLARIENCDEGLIAYLAKTIPPQWYGSDYAAMDDLVCRLIKRRKIVRELIANFRESSKQPFPNWRGPMVTCGAKTLQASA